MMRPLLGFPKTGGAVTMAVRSSSGRYWGPVCSLTVTLPATHRYRHVHGSVTSGCRT